MHFLLKVAKLKTKSRITKINIMHDNIYSSWYNRQIIFDSIEHFMPHWKHYSPERTVLACRQKFCPSHQLSINFRAVLTSMTTHRSHVEILHDPSLQSFFVCVWAPKKTPCMLTSGANLNSFLSCICKW